MKIKYYLFALTMCTMVYSCKILSPKEYKALVSERDSLQNRTVNLEAEVTNLQADTARLHRELAELHRKYDDLNDNYNSSASKVTQLSSDLEKREARLKEVE